MHIEKGIYTLGVQLPLDCGELLAAPQVAFETYGNPQAKRAIALIHGFSTSHRVAEPLEGEPLPFALDGFLQGVIGPGQPFDTSDTLILSLGLLGAPFGSSSPISANPEHGAMWGPAFFPVTADDMARAASACARALGVKRLEAVVGWDLGGIVALQMGSLFPEFVKRVAMLGACLALPDATRRTLFEFRGALEADRAWQGGWYGPGEEPRAPFQKGRLAHLRLLHGPNGLERREGDLFAVEKALTAEAAHFIANHDARAYAALCEAWGRVDLYERLPQHRLQVLVGASATDLLCPPERVRDAHHRLHAAGCQASYFEIQTGFGHRAFELEPTKWASRVRSFIDDGS